MWDGIEILKGKLFPLGQSFLHKTWWLSRVSLEKRVKSPLYSYEKRVLIPKLLIKSFILQASILLFFLTCLALWNLLVNLGKGLQEPFYKPTSDWI